MVGSNVRLTPKGWSVAALVSRMAMRNASGLGWVRAVRIPASSIMYHPEMQLIRRTQPSCVGDSSYEWWCTNPMRSSK